MNSIQGELLGLFVQNINATVAHIQSQGTQLHPQGYHQPLEVVRVLHGENGAGELSERLMSQIGRKVLHWPEKECMESGGDSGSNWGGKLPVLAGNSHCQEQPENHHQYIDESKFFNIKGEVSANKDQESG